MTDARAITYVNDIDYNDPDSCAAAYARTRQEISALERYVERLRKRLSVAQDDATVDRYAALVSEALNTLEFYCEFAKTLEPLIQDDSSNLEDE